MRPFERGQFLLDQRRRGALAARLHAREQVALQAVLVGDEALEVGIVRVGLRREVEQVERAAGGRREVGGDGRDDAARRAGDQEDGVLVQRQPGPAVDDGLFLETDGPAQAVLDSRSRPRRGRAASPSIRSSAISDGVASRLEVDGLDERIRPLALVGLGEAGDRAAQRRERARFVVAVLAAEPRGGHRKVPGRRDLVVQRAHGGVERLRRECAGPHASRRGPWRRGRPRRPARAASRRRRTGATRRAPRSIDRRPRRRRPASLLRERVADAAPDRGMIDDAPARLERYAGRLAQRERRAEHRNRHAARDGVGGFEASRARRARLRACRRAAAARHRWPCRSAAN